MKLNIKWNALEKRQLLIFVLAAFVVPYVLGIAMGAGFYAGSDVSFFASAQMFYPAAGVMLALLFTRKGDSMLPRKFFVCFLVLTVLMLACSLASVLVPVLPWALIGNYVMMGGTLAAWVCYFADGKARRAAYGLRLTGTGGTNSFLMLALFMVLYFARIFILSGLMTLAAPSLAADAAMPEWWSPLIALFNLALMPLSFVLAFTAFFGEEYGWRGFLQPLLQKQFGPRGGILVLGAVWGLWHLPINIFYYSPDTWVLSVLNQVFLCVCYSVFFGFAYAKTKSIWAPVMIHFFNNNVVLLFASADSIGSQVLDWLSILLSLAVMGILYLPFFASRVFRQGGAVPGLPRHEGAACAGAVSEKE